MFVGHLALALGAKRYRPAVGLGWFIAAVTTLDLIWPILVLVGIERVRIVPGATAFNPLVFDSYPWSHSLVMSGVWGVALAAIARWRGVAASDARWIGALVVSHWVLDFITHAPDMPLWPGPSPHLGLSLWNSVPATYVVEGGMWVAAIFLYLGARPLRGWSSHAAFWSLVVVTTVMWAMSPWSAPPPSERALGWFAMIGWLLVPWAWLADRRRAVPATA